MINKESGLHVEVTPINNPSLTEQSVQMEKGEKRIIEYFNGLIAPEIFDENGNGLWIVREYPSEPFPEEPEPMPTPEAIDLSDIELLLEYNDIHKDKLTYRKETENINDVWKGYFLYNITRITGTNIHGYRLVYHKTKFTNKVNEKMAEVFSRFDKANANGESIGDMVDQTREDIKRLVETINKFFDHQNNHLDELTRVGYDIKEHWKLIGEKEEFLRYAAIHMCQFWLELNSRYDYRKMELSEDVGSFYADFLSNIKDLGGYDIIPAPDYDKTAAQIKNTRNDFGLCLHADNSYCEAIKNNLIAVLLSHKLIRPEDENAVRKFFSGHCEDVIPWQGAYATLVHFIKGIMEIETKKYGPLVTLPDGAKNIWKDVVSRRFLVFNKDGKPYDHEQLRKAPKPRNTVYTALVKIFQDQARKIDEFYKP